eukprot:gene17817-24198_t
MECCQACSRLMEFLPGLLTCRSGLNGWHGAPLEPGTEPLPAYLEPPSPACTTDLTTTTHLAAILTATISAVHIFRSLSFCRTPRMQTCVSMNQATAFRRNFSPFKGVAKRVPCIRAASPETPTPTPTPTPPSTSAKKDSETIKDVFSWDGPLPERLNGRMAMVGFLGVALTENSNHTPAMEQLGNSWGFVLAYVLIFTFASIAPKLVSTTSLKTLHETATVENLEGGEGAAAAVAFFEANTELLTGRVAMLGLVGLAIGEAVRGDSFF